MQNRTRLGSITEVPPGVSDFELRISVPANQPTPLKLAIQGSFSASSATVSAGGRWGDLALIRLAPHPS